MNKFLTLCVFFVILSSKVLAGDTNLIIALQPNSCYNGTNCVKITVGYPTNYLSTLRLEVSTDLRGENWRTVVTEEFLGVDQGPGWKIYYLLSEPLGSAFFREKGVLK